MTPPLQPLTPEEAARRRATSHRIAWALGGVVLLLYLVGLFIPR